MDTDALLDSAINYITSIFSQNTDGHDTEHSLRVYHYAAKLAAHYPEAKKLALKKHAYMKNMHMHLKRIFLFLSIPIIPVID